MAGLAAALSLHCGTGLGAPAGPATGVLPGAVGFEQIEFQTDGHMLHGAVWYPSAPPQAVMTVGMSTQIVAEHGRIAGRNLPLIVVSHGALGAWPNHADTAVALAQAGFAVAAVTFDEVSAGAARLSARNRQLTALIDFMLHAWRGHAALDQARVGAFGFSLGGFTVLVAAGGTPDPGRMAAHCKTDPQEWSCVLSARGRLDFAAQPSWLHDARIKAAVVAAPALGYLFGRAGLAGVRAPVQLWQAGDDQVLAEPWNAEAVRHDLPSPPEYHLVAHADHADFIAPCAPQAAARAPSICLDASGFDRAAFHPGFNAAIVGFFKRTLGVSAPP